MIRIIEFISIGFIGGFLLAILLKKLLTIGMIKTYAPLFMFGLINRLDRALTGNDGNYSHTRIINMVWGVGGFILVCICTVRSIKIPENILMLIGGAMGANITQTIFNKRQEVAQVIATLNKDSNKDDSNG